MRIIGIDIQNFRKLFGCHIDISKETTLFVGANNSGKTSAMDALAKFLANRSFVFNDITIAKRIDINRIGTKWVEADCEQPADLLDWDTIVPKMDIWLDVAPNEMHYVASIIPTLKWRGGKLGVRLALLPKDVSNLFNEYREAYSSARTTEHARVEKSSFNLFPKDLCEFLDRKLTTYFSIKAFILDPSHFEDAPVQPTSFEAECLTDNPLKDIVRVDMIDAQRGFADPDSSEGTEKVRKQLSAQMRNYYEKHLDPEKAPSPEDLDILEATEGARQVFDKTLALKFAPAIKELEGLGYPGISDPKLTITTKVMTSETLKHDSAVQYALSKTDNTLKLPEKYNGLGYQNLISMVFDLMGFRDDWMREGKAKDTNTVIEPMHLVLVEEPEAHLHIQVQQVFIRQAYKVLTNHKFLKQNLNFTTQLVISTHSSHIAIETTFGNLRYFKRLPEGTECAVATSKVINLSDVFGDSDQTNKFVTRYLQSTHCDLFFADAAILVEGVAESMLLPHFIRSKFPELYQRYITILGVNGRHAHRLSPLIEKLCLPTLVITDLDPAEKEGYHKSVVPKRGEGQISGNYAIAKWLMKEKDIDKLVDYSEDKKEFSFASPYRFSIRLAYQTPVKVDFEGEEKEAIPGTFEDCLIYTNYTQQQRPRSDAEVGNVRLFIVSSDANKEVTEQRVAEIMSEETGDGEWRDSKQYKSLILEHHMAASRFGFLELYLPLNEVPVFNTSLRDGSISELSFLSKVISPLVQAYKGNNDFEVLKIVKEYSPLMESKKWISLDDQTKALQQVESAVDKLMELWKDDAIPTCLDVLRSIQDTGLFKLDERVDNILSSPAADESIRITALRKALSVPFTTLEKYFAYVSDNTRFATHQGVKGLEFPRVMVIIDDAEAKGFLFSYEKLFGVKLKTETDIKNEREGKDNSITRTTRLFYVACTRAQKSLAIIAYTYDCEAVKATAMKNNWFEDDEIRLLE